MLLEGSMPGLRICAWILCFSVAVNASYGLCRESESLSAERGECFVEMLCCEDEDIVEITLKIDSLEGVWGVLAALEYDSESFALISCIGEADGLEFSHSDSEGRIILLFDGAQGCNSLLARFCFEKKAGGKNGGVFRLGKFEAYGFCECAGIYEMPTEILCGEITAVVGEEKKERNVWVESVILERREDGENEVVVCGGTSGDFFAAGFKVFIIELESLNYETVYISGVLAIGEERLERRVLTDFDGDISIIVTPIGYGREAFLGEKRVSVFLK